MELHNRLLMVRALVLRPNDWKQASKANFQKHSDRDEDSSKENTDEEDSFEEAQMQQMPGDPKTLSQIQVLEMPTPPHNLKPKNWSELCFQQS